MQSEPKTTPLKEEAITALENRLLNAEVVANLGWESLEGWGKGWIAIPYFRRGRVVNYKYRTITGEKKFSQTKGGEQCFYNLAAIEDMERMGADSLESMELVITEGEMDCVAALQCGYMAVSVPNGAPKEQVDDEDSKKFHFLKDLPDKVVCVLATDTDEAGQVLQQELAKRIGIWRCKRVIYPKGCKDLNETLIKFGTKGVHKALKEKTQFFHVAGVFRMEDLPEVPYVEPKPAKIAGMDDRLLIRRGDFIVVSGIPSHGKTTFVNEVACNMVKHYGWNVCFGSFELNPRQDHHRLLRTYYIRKAWKDDNGVVQWTPDEIADADDWINKHFSFIVPDVDDDRLATFEWLVEKIHAAVVRFKAQMIVIDPWNELDHDRPMGMSLTEYTGFAIKQFKRLAKKYMVTIIVVAHPAKLERNRFGKYDPPTLYDISDSSHWYNKCDIGMVVHRKRFDEVTSAGTKVHNVTLARILKVRHMNIIGKPSDTWLEYKPYQASFEQFDPVLLGRLEAMEIAERKAKDAERKARSSPKKKDEEKKKQEDEIETEKEGDKTDLLC